MARKTSSRRCSSSWPLNCVLSRRTWLGLKTSTSCSFRIMVVTSLRRFRWRDWRRRVPARAVELVAIVTLDLSFVEMENNWACQLEPLKIGEMSQNWARKYPVIMRWFRGFKEQPRTNGPRTQCAAAPTRSWVPNYGVMAQPRGSAGSDVPPGPSLKEGPGKLPAPVQAGSGGFSRRKVRLSGARQRQRPGWR